VPVLCFLLYASCLLLHSALFRCTSTRNILVRSPRCCFVHGPTLCHMGSNCQRSLSEQCHPSLPKNSLTRVEERSEEVMTSNVFVPQVGGPDASQARKFFCQWYSWVKWLTRSSIFLAFRFVSESVNHAEGRNWYPRSTFARTKVLHVAMISSKGADKLANKTSKLVVAHSSPNTTYMQPEYQLVSINTIIVIPLTLIVTTRACRLR
jgi:hypothetical protein